MITEKEAEKAFRAAAERRGWATEKIGGSAWCNGLPDLLIAIPPRADAARGATVVVEMKRALRRKITCAGDALLLCRSGKERSRQQGIAVDFAMRRAAYFVVVAACDADVESARSLRELPDAWSATWCGDFTAGRLSLPTRWGSLQEALDVVAGPALGPPSLLR